MGDIVNDQNTTTPQEAERPGRTTEDLPCCDHERTSFAQDDNFHASRPVLDELILEAQMLEPGY